MSFLQVERPIDGITSDVIFDIFGYPITNSTIFIFLIIAIIIGLSFFIRRFSVVPSFGQSIVELIYEKIEGLISLITSSKHHTKKIFPFVAAVIVFIAFSNLLGMIPGITSFTYDGKSLLRIPTADFNTTFSLALGSMILIQIFSIIDWGLFGYLGRFIKLKEVYLGFKKGIGPGILSIVDFLIGLLDIIGELAKIVSLSLRLFGNLYAGIVLGVVVFGAMAYIVPIALFALGLLSGVVQTIVFGSLVTVFYMLSIKAEEKV